MLKAVSAITAETINMVTFRTAVPMEHSLLRCSYGTFITHSQSWRGVGAVVGGVVGVGSSVGVGTSVVLPSVPVSLEMLVATSLTPRVAEHHWSCCLWMEVVLRMALEIPSGTASETASGTVSETLLAMASGTVRWR